MRCQIPNYLLQIAKICNLFGVLYLKILIIKCCRRIFDFRISLIIFSIKVYTGLDKKEKIDFYKKWYRTSYNNISITFSHVGKGGASWDFFFLSRKLTLVINFCEESLFSVLISHIIATLSSIKVKVVFQSTRCYFCACLKIHLVS